MSVEEIMLGKAINKYKDLKKAILASSQARAIEKKLAERADKDLEQEQEIYDKIGNSANITNRFSNWKDKRILCSCDIFTRSAKISQLLFSPDWFE